MPKKQPDLPEVLSQFTIDLVEDLKLLRKGKISTRDARARALLAREILRSVHLQLEGMKYLSESARQIEAPK